MPGWWKRRRLLEAAAGASWIGGARLAAPALQPGEDEIVARRIEEDLA
jgi:hypothetical protein